MNKLRVAINTKLSSDQPREADVGLHPVNKLQFGKTVPFFRFHLGGECIKDQGQSLRGPEIPAVRAQAAISRIELTFNADGIPGESFSNWVCRRELPFFTELLDDFINVAPTDLPELLRDHGHTQHFKDLPPINGGGLETGEGHIAGIITEALEAQKKSLDLFKKGDLAKAVQLNNALLELGVKAIALSFDARPDDYEDAVILIDQLCPDEPLLADEYNALQTAIKNIELNQDDIRRLFQAADIWLHHIIRLCEQEKAIQPNEIKVTNFVDMSKASTPIAFLKAKRVLATDHANNQVIKLQLRNKTSADYIAHGLESLGHRVVWNQSNAADTRWILGIQKIQNNVIETTH